MSVKRIHVAELFDGEHFVNDKVLSVDAGIITAIDDNVQQADEHLTGLVAPGFIDLQVNGGGGELFNRTSSVAGVKKYC